MEDLDDLLSSILLTEEKILELVDEYSLYAHYLGGPIETRKAYLSPLREESKPSFGIFESTRGRQTACEYRWKDSALNLSGDIIDLVRRLYQLPSREAALKHIDQEFELGLSISNGQSTINRNHHVYKKPPKKAPAQISIRRCPWTNQGLTFWKKYGIDQVLLQKYAVAQISAFWTQPEQQTPFTPKGVAFAYEINGYYKIYQPHNKDMRFLNNYPENYVEGFLQLPASGDLCIITKSLKDVCVLDSLGYASCSPRSESTPFPQHLLEQLKKRFTKVVTFFDNDVGKEQNWGQLGAAKYDLPTIFIPDHLAQQGAKDISDHYKLFGKQATQQLLTTLLS